ncbi:MAG: hypothetical protein PHU21_04205, partial [Elusimicrobia bacterium]|nr:hypothetical protein [Elusimicrobiota bacterium]
MSARRRLGLKFVASALAYLLSVQSALAAVQSLQVQAGALPVGAAGAVGSSLQASHLTAGASALSGISLSPLSRPSLSAVPSVAPSGLLVAPSAAGDSVRAAPAGLPMPPAAAGAAVPVAEAVRALSEGKLQPAAQAADEAVQGVAKASSDDSKGSAEKQFSVLTGESRAQGASDIADPVPAAEPSAAKGPSLEPPAQSRTEAKPAIPAAPASEAKGGFGQVFKDPERNRSFWRYVLGNIIYTFGIEMYMVGLPYLVSAFTKNSLRENNDPRAGNAEVVQALVRENRSLVRIAHWAAQAFSYASVPLFTKNTDGSLKWLPRSFWIRSAVLGGIVGLFFASGVLSLSGVLYTLLAFIAVQSFFQG